MDRLSKGIAVGKMLFQEATHQARRIEEDLKARREVDVAGMVAGLRARLSEQLTLVPLPIDGDLALKSGRLGLGISIISYANNICLGIATDAGLVPHPDGIMLGFYAEYDELLGLV